MSVRRESIIENKVCGWLEKDVIWCCMECEACIHVGTRQDAERSEHGVWGEGGGAHEGGQIGLDFAIISTYQSRTKMKNVVTKGTKRTGLKLRVPLAQSGTAHEVQMIASMASVNAMILSDSCSLPIRPLTRMLFCMPKVLNWGSMESLAARWRSGASIALACR